MRSYFWTVEYVLYRVDNMVLERYNIGTQYIKINYDRCVHALLGRNIINKLAVHIEPKDNGVSYLLAVLKEQSDKSEYYVVLKELFALEPCGRGLSRLLRGH